MFLFIAGPPAIIEVDIVVRSMGPISEMDMVGGVVIYLPISDDWF